MLEALIEVIVGLLFYGTAKVILPLISFGKWRADMKKSKASWLSGWPYARKDKDGITYFSYEGGILFGLLFWVIVMVIFWPK